MFTKVEFWYWYIPVMIVSGLFFSRMVMDGFFSVPVALMLIVLEAVILRVSAKRINPPAQKSESEDQ